MGGGLGEGGMLLALVGAAFAQCRWTTAVAGDAGDDWVQIGTFVWDVRSMDELDRVWNEALRCRWTASANALQAWYQRRKSTDLQAAFAAAVAADSAAMVRAAEAEAQRAAEARRLADVARLEAEAAAGEAAERLRLEREADAKREAEESARRAAQAAAEAAAATEARRAAGAARVPLEAKAPCQVGYATRVTPTFYTREALVEQERAAAEVAMRAVRPQPPAVFVLEVEGPTIDLAQPGDLLAIVKNASGAEVFRQRLDREVPDVPGSDRLWTAFAQVTLSRALTFPAHLFVVNEITPSRCEWLITDWDWPAQVDGG